MTAKIASLHAVQIIDSRGNPTVSVRAALEDGSNAIASVPSGASTGEFEAVELRDGDETKYRGKGVTRAVGHVNDVIQKKLKGMDASDQRAVDEALLALDGTANKQKLGANAILGVSLAVAHAVAKSKRIELFQSLGGDRATLLPVPLVNVINGGAHANNSLDSEIAQIQNKIYAVQHSTAVLEKLAREEVGLSKPDDIVYIFPEPKTAEAAAAPVQRHPDMPVSDRLVPEKLGKPNRAR